MTPQNFQLTYQLPFDFQRVAKRDLFQLHSGLQARTVWLLIALVHSLESAKCSVRLTVAVYGLPCMHAQAHAHTHAHAHAHASLTGWWFTYCRLLPWQAPARQRWLAAWADDLACFAFGLAHCVTVMYYSVDRTTKLALQSSDLRPPWLGPTVRLSLSWLQLMLSGSALTYAATMQRLLHTKVWLLCHLLARLSA